MSSIFAIGDVHGCARELNELLNLIDAQNGDTVVFLGDYIDRGPDSRGVIEAVRAYSPEGINVIRLKGNHEDMMCQAHTDRSSFGWWLRNGGAQTLDSYGGHIPAEVLEWAASLPTSFAKGGFFFCHAGVDPDMALANQSDETLMWIRSKFLMSPKNHGAVVVHGHTPVSVPEVKANRINVDTACVYGSALTCVVLDGGEPWFIQARSA